MGGKLAQLNTTSTSAETTSRNAPRYSSVWRVRSDSSARPMRSPQGSRGAAGALVPTAGLAAGGATQSGVGRGEVSASGRAVSGATTAGASTGGIALGSIDAG